MEATEGLGQKVEAGGYPLVAVIWRNREHEVSASLGEYERLVIAQLAEGEGRRTLTGELPRSWKVEVAENFPEECRYVLETLRNVYHNDALAQEQAMSPEDRLRFHQMHGGPLMNGLHEWMEAQLAEHRTEPNSGLGKAISYY